MLPAIISKVKNTVLLDGIMISFKQINEDFNLCFQTVKWI